MLYLHLHTLHLHPPGVCRLIQSSLHIVRDLLPLRQHLSQALGAKTISLKQNLFSVIHYSIIFHLSVVAASRWVECL